jgi:hypothetical protein
MISTLFAETVRQLVVFYSVRCLKVHAGFHIRDDLCAPADAEMETSTQSTSGGSNTSLQCLPLHIQAHLFASAGAPLTTCKASAAIAKDDLLVAQWLRARHQYPLHQAADHQLWAACEQLLPCCWACALASQIVYLAAKAGQLRLVKLIISYLECHAPDEVDRSVQHALLAAAEHNHPALCSYLMDCGDADEGMVREAVCRAADAGHIDIISLLVDECPEASSPGLGESPLFLAAANGHNAAVRLLLEHGAHPECRAGTPWSDGSCCPPITFAAQAGHLDTVRLLLDSGADPTHGNALTHAAFEHHTAVMQLLLSRGADVNAYGGSALAAAISTGDASAVELLLRAGAQVRHNLKELRKAIQDSQWSVVCLLLQHGATLRTSPALRKQLVAAAEGSRLDVVRLSMRAGVTPLPLDVPLLRRLAEAAGDLELLALLERLT